MKKKLCGLLSGMRPLVSIPAGALIHIGSRLNDIDTNWLLAVTASVICGLTMLTNDYFDRFHDANKKRKDFALANEKLIQKVLFFGWLSVVLVSIFALQPHSTELVVICCVCILYSFSRHVYALPALLTSTISGLAVLLPNLGANNMSTIDMCIIVTIAIFGREIIKDAEDRFIDGGYKKTFFTESDPSEHKFWLRLAGFCFLLSGLKMLTFGLDLPREKFFFCITGVCLIVFSSLLLLFRRSIYGKTKSKLYFDIGMVFVLFSLSI